MALTGAKDSARLFKDLDVRVLLALVLAAWATAGLSSLRSSIRAANGPSWLDTNVKERVQTMESTGQRDLRRARAAAVDLRKAQQLLWIGIGLFVILVVLQWTIPYEAQLDLPVVPG